jgi:Ala-tRNA(Pro) deacylase
LAAGAGWPLTYLAYPKGGAIAMNCKERVETFLGERHVPFEEQHHPVAFTAQQVAATEHIPGKQVAKVVVVYADGRPAMLALPAPYRVNWNRAITTTGAQSVRLAREDEIKSLFPDSEIGAMPPFGNLYQMPVYVDRALTENEKIVVQAGTHTETISLKYQDFAQLVQPKVADFAVAPGPGPN